jgi:hypothetical protein
MPDPSSMGAWIPWALVTDTVMARATLNAGLRLPRRPAVNRTPFLWAPDGAVPSPRRPALCRRLPTGHSGSLGNAGNLIPEERPQGYAPVQKARLSRMSRRGRNRQG